MFAGRQQGGKAEDCYLFHQQAAGVAVLMLPTPQSKFQIGTTPNAGCFQAAKKCTVAQNVHSNVVFFPAFQSLSHKLNEIIFLFPGWQRLINIVIGVIKNFVCICVFDCPFCV